MTPEGKIKALVKRELLSKFPDDAWVFMPVQTGYGRPALDFIICFRGHFVTVETKTPVGAFRPSQKMTREETLKAGGMVFCVYDDETCMEMIGVLTDLSWTEHRRYGPIHGQAKRERK